MKRGQGYLASHGYLEQAERLPNLCFLLGKFFMGIIFLWLELKGGCSCHVIPKVYAVSVLAALRYIWIEYTWWTHPMKLWFDECSSYLECRRTVYNMFLYLRYSSEIDDIYKMGITLLSCRSSLPSSSWWRFWTLQKCRRYLERNSWKSFQVKLEHQRWHPGRVTDPKLLTFYITQHWMYLTLLALRFLTALYFQHIVVSEWKWISNTSSFSTWII